MARLLTKDAFLAARKVNAVSVGGDEIMIRELTVREMNALLAAVDACGDDGGAVLSAVSPILAPLIVDEDGGAIFADGEELAAAMTLGQLMQIIESLADTASPAAAQKN